MSKKNVAHTLQGKQIRIFYIDYIAIHTDKYYSKNSYLGPEEMPLNKNPVGSTVFHANFIASVADTARIFYLK